jgi:hypothetical protein
VINIIEADFNLMIGILWGRRLLEHSEEWEKLGEVQWGSRKGKSYLDAVLLKELTYEIARYTRTDLATFDNDAKSCYDRIVMSYAMLRCQQLGMPKSACQCLGDFLDNADYHLKTQLGISEETWRNTARLPTHGPGQGNRGAPALWTFVSTAAMKILSSLHKGVSFTDPQDNFHTNRVMDGFVDDTTVWANNFVQQLLQATRDRWNDDAALTLLQDLLTNTTEIAQCWEKLLYTTGGKLECKKCFFYIMHWCFAPSGEPYLAEIKDTPGTIQITDSTTNKISPIKQKECHAAHRTLGVQLCPNSDSTAEETRIKNTSKDIEKALNAITITHIEAATFQRAISHTRMAHTLPVTHLTEDQLNGAQSAATMAILPRMGYNRHSPREVVHGPRNLGGIDIRRLYVEQGAQHIIQLIRHLRKNSGALFDQFWIAIGWIQKFLGTSENFLQETNQPLPHMLDGWFRTTREFLRESECTIDFQDAPTLEKRREHDANLMDDACAQLSEIDVDHINWCRLFLQVEFLSDISTLEGHAISPHIFRTCKNKTPIAPSKPAELYPIQGLPGHEQWNTWKKFITTNYCKSPDNLTLRTKLGQWS